MATLRVGNAPCSWGRLEFEEAKGEQIGFGQMLDELAATGYTGTELGDWGYMPTAPALLKRGLGMRSGRHGCWCRLRPSQNPILCWRTIMARFQSELAMPAGSPRNWA